MPKKTRTARSKAVTGNAIIRAYSKSIKHLLAEELISCSVSAGFIIPSGQKLGEEEGIQVFVQAAKYSASRLKAKKDSGGLFIYGNR